MTFNVMAISLIITQLKSKISNQSFGSPDTDPRTLLAACKMMFSVTITKNSKECAVPQF